MAEGVSHAEVRGCYLGVGVQDSVVPHKDNGSSVGQRDIQRFEANSESHLRTHTDTVRSFPDSVHVP